MATTPPVTTVIHSPSTPRHRGETSRHYGTRQSTRTRGARAVHTPPSDTRSVHEQLASFKKRKTSSSHSTVTPHSPPSSTHTSPRHKIVRGKTSGASDTTNIHKRTMDDLVQARDSTNNEQAISNQAQPAGPSALPTPVSLPRKKAVSRKFVDSTARVLFPSRADPAEDAMPTPRKNRKNRKHVGFSLYSSMEDDGTSSEDRIQIYTDSKDKVPELDMSEDNPFIERPQEQSPHPGPLKPRSGSKRKNSPRIQSNPQIEEAFNRDQGMVYVL